MDLAVAPCSDGRKASPFCVGIVASAGGIAALSRVLTKLPQDFPAAVAVVLHLMPDRISRLSEVLGRETSLPVAQALGGEVLVAGTVLVAPPNQHLVVTAGGTTALTDAPREHFARPSGNPLFASLAKYYGKHAVAVILTGYDGDGAAGLQLVKQAGGATIAQNEASSVQFSMPRTAIVTGDVDQILDIDAIGPALCRLVAG